MLKSVLLLVISAVLFSSPRAAVRQVASGADLQSAIDAAETGDTLNVAAGNFTAPFSISKRLTLLGGYNAQFTARNSAENVSILQGTAASSVVTLQDRSSGSVIDGFTIRGGRQGILCNDEVWPPIGGITISNNIIRENGDPGREHGGLSLTGNDNRITSNVFYGNTALKGAAIGGGDSNYIAWNLIDSNIAHGDHGGGLYLSGHPVLDHNIIRKNRVGETAGYGWGGGGIIFGNYTTTGSSKGGMSFDIIHGNSAPSHGGGFFIDDGAVVTLDHELICDNTVTQEFGGGLYVDGGTAESQATLINCTIVNNHSAGNRGDGIIVDGKASVFLNSCIVWGNGATFTELEPMARLTATYSLLQEEWPGTGNITGDPLFADTSGHDYHLKSTVGRYNPKASGSPQVWLQDPVSSPAIDAGDPAFEFPLEPAHGNRINMGCYGNTAEASKSSGSLATRCGAALSEYFRFECHPDLRQGTIRITFSIPFTLPVRLTIVDMKGKTLETLIARPLSPGNYQAVGEFNRYAAGTYVLTLQAGDFIVSRTIRMYDLSTTSKGRM